MIDLKYLEFLKISSQITAREILKVLQNRTKHFTIAVERCVPDNTSAVMRSCEVLIQELNVIEQRYGKYR
jgi:hypothetical protein